MLHSSRTLCSRGWASAQARDPFVQEARRKGYIARSAFKLLQIDNRFQIMSPKTTRCAIDLGASPGGWCQVIRERASPQCLIFGVDMIDLRASIPNAHFLKGDFSTQATQKQLLDQLHAREVIGNVDLVTSDMCPNRTGGIEDRYRIAELCMSSLNFAVHVLAPGGNFVCKILGSGSPMFQDLHRVAATWFTTAKAHKPLASRDASDEMFLVCSRKLHEKREVVHHSIAGGSGLVRDGDAACVTPRYGLDDWPGQMRHSPRSRSRR